jgi:hypothetical protein
MMLDRYVPARDRPTDRQRGRWLDVPLRRLSRNDIAPRSSAPSYNERFPCRSSANTTAQRSSPDGVASHDIIKLDTSLPKNFEKPLTCFFWNQFGRCNKRDMDCAYAHWDTGFMAGAPINFPGCMVLPSTHIPFQM